jgi:hypothetical protein
LKAAWSPPTRTASLLRLSSMACPQAMEVSEWGDGHAPNGCGTGCLVWLGARTLVVHLGGCCFSCAHWRPHCSLCLAMKGGCPCFALGVPVALPVGVRRSHRRRAHQRYEDSQQRLPCCSCKAGRRLQPLSATGMASLIGRQTDGRAAQLPYYLWGRAPSNT